MDIVGNGTIHIKARGGCLNCSRGKFALCQLQQNVEGVDMIAD